MLTLSQVHFEVPHPLLVCTYTNVAVDNLVEGLAASGVRPLRVGFGGKVKESLVEHTLDYKLAQHPLKPNLEVLVKKEEAVALRIRDINKMLEEKLAEAREFHSKGTSAHKIERTRQMVANMEADLALRARMQMSLKSRIYALEMEMLHDVVSKADVVCCIRPYGRSRLISSRSARRA